MNWPRSARRRVLFTAFYLVFLIALSWGGIQLYWSCRLGVPLIAAKVDVWDRYYPELRRSGVLTADVRRNDSTIDVLMLGASTIEHGWGNVEELLLSGLQSAFGERVRVFNLATISHTSRDSALKFSRIADKPFDLILIYDGFNDCRMNNCPPELFRNDYSHCAWYKSFEVRRNTGLVNLPREMLNDVASVIGLGPPEENLVQYGGDLKTPPAFRHNLQEILSSAAQQQTPVLLQTFAYHIPADYSDERLQSGSLDFGKAPSGRKCPLQMWGRTVDVVKCVDAHNQIIRELASSDPQGTIFVDQQKLMSEDGKNFVDACHFTDLGCRKFVDNLLPKVVQRLRPR